MRRKSFTVAAMALLCLLNNVARTQDCVRTGLNRSTVISNCDQFCRDLTFQVPDLRSSNDYVFVNTVYDPFPFVTATGTTDDRLYDDDTYSQPFDLPFPFCFYGTVYTRAIVSSNGLITFDPAYSACPVTAAAYDIVSGLPYISSGGDCTIDHYPRASIMGVFMDLDPRPSETSPVQSSPPDRKIEWRVEGVAPCRRFVVSFYHIGVFQNTECGRQTPATFQIVIYESSGLIDVYIENKTCIANGPNGAKAILGIQDMTRTRFLTAPGKNGTPGWTANHEGFRFVPNGGSSRFSKAELFRLDMTPLGLATTTSTTPGLLDIKFPNICTSVPGLSEDYIIRTTYSACHDPSIELIGLDTITVTRSTENFAPVLDIDGTTCASSHDGRIQVSTSVGLAPYTFVLNPGNVVQTGTSGDFAGLTAGAYTLNISDARGCRSAPIPVVLPEGTNFIATSSTTDVLCNGAATGSITMIPPPVGAAPVEYSLDGVTWQTNTVFSNLAAGAYTVRYREANGCQNSLPVTISEPPLLTTAAATVVPVKCHGEANGSITIHASGGVTPYEYSKDGGVTWQNNPLFSVAAGVYTITIRDANNCTATQGVTVTEPALLTASAVTGTASCDGGNDGVITITAAGGNGSFQYALDGGAFQASTIFNTGPGSYIITVKDALGCTTTVPATVALLNNLTYVPQTDETICESSNVQLALVSNASQWQWTPATGLSATTIPNPVASPVITTEYIVKADLGRCSFSDTVMVVVNPAPVPDAGEDAVICFGQTYRLHATGGTVYKWTPSTYLDDPSLPDPLSTPLKTIAYRLDILADDKGCPSLVTDEVVINVTPPIKVRTIPFDTIVYSGDRIQLQAIASDPGIVHYEWSPVAGLNDPSIAAPVATTGAVGDIARYRVVTSTAAGCKGEGFVTIRVYKGPDIYVPTGFTPNNDGRNDRFMPVPVGIKQYNYFRVYNRWGQLLFSTTNMQQGWDGKLNGQEQPTGTYVWMIEGVTQDNRVITKKGTVTVIR